MDSATVTLLLNSFFLLLFTRSSFGASQTSPTIGIVGGGISGASTAHFVRELFGPKVSIDVFEPDMVGGRLATLEIGGRHYESGGSVIHPRNKYMVNFTQQLGLQRNELEGGRLGIFDGEKMVFDGSSNSIMLAAQLLWHYGWDVYRLRTFIKETLSKFERIYEHQAAGHSFTTPEKLLRSMAPELVDSLHHSTEEEMLAKGFSQKFLDEVVLGVMRNNYGQTTSIQSFVGSVSMAGAEAGLWSVRGGNKLVPEGLLKKARVKLIRSDVGQVTLISQEGRIRYGITYRGTNGDDFANVYDIVIIATPLHDRISGIRFAQFPGPIAVFPQHYSKTTANFVRGVPNLTKFGFSRLDQFPDALFTSNPNLFYNSIGRQAPVDPDDQQAPMVWKVFSRDPLSEAEIQELFSAHEEVKVEQWVGAYPAYTSDERNLPEFELHDMLFYSSGLELTASAMEMGAIAGRNVAQLAYNRWTGRTSHIDADLTGDKISDEL